MKKLAPITLTLLLLAALLFYSTSSHPLRAATPADPANAQKLTEDFAPWISAVILQKWNVANKLHPLSRRAETFSQSSATTDIFARFTKLDATPLTLIGAHTLGQNIGTLLFTAPTEDGPVAFKISYYQFNQQTYVGKLEIADHWNDIETLSLSVDPLQSPTTTMLQSHPQ